MSHNRTNKIRRTLAGLAALTTFATLASAPATQADVTDVVGRLIASTTDILGLLTYDVHTTFKKPDGTTLDRTTGAVVGVPKLVDVNGGLPDLSVSILPLPDRLRLSVSKLPTAPTNLPVLVEAVIDLPAGDGPGLGVAYGYDQTASTAPRGFTTDLLFSIFRLPSSENLTLVAAPTGAPAALTVIGTLFTAGDGAARVDPKAARLRLSPVPGKVTLDAGLSTREAQPAEGDNLPITARDEATVRVRTDRLVHATATVSDTQGEFRRDIVTDITDLPTDVTVGYADESLEETATRVRRQQELSYTASGRIGLLAVTVDETTSGVAQKAIRATVENVPKTMSASLLSEDQAGVADPAQPDAQVATRSVAYQADSSASELTLTADTFEDGTLAQQLKGVATGLPSAFVFQRRVRGTDDPETDKTESTQQIEFDAPGAPLGSLEAGVAEGKAVDFIDPKQFFRPGDLETGEEPGYAFARGDDLALRLFGISRAVVDTGDPLHVEVEAQPGPFLARVIKGPLEITGQVLDFPGKATVDFSPGIDATPTEPASPPFVRYHGETGIEEIRAVATNTKPGQALFDRVKTAAVDVHDVPTDLDLTLDTKDPDAPPPPDGTTQTLASFDTHGHPVGLLEVLLTSGTDADDFPSGVDGVVLRDLPDRYVAAGRITGLTKATLTRTEVRGDPDTFRVQSSTTTASLDAPHVGVLPLLIDLDEQDASGRHRTIVKLADRPDEVTDLTLLEEQTALPDIITPFIESPIPRKTALRYRANEDSGEMSVCLRVGELAADFDCSGQDFDQQIGVHGLTARVDKIPASLDVCLGSDRTELARNGRIPRVDCLGGPDTQPYDEKALCNDTDGEVFRLECFDEELPINMSLLFRASSPVTLNLQNCQDDEALEAGKACILESGAAFARIRDLHLQALRAQIDKPITDDENNDNGYAYFDTQADEQVASITGSLLLDSARGARIEATFPDKVDPTQEFHAENRFVVFEPLLLGINVIPPVFGTCNRGDAQIKVSILDVGNDFCF